MDFDGKLDGFKEFDKLLRELPRNVENRVLQGAVTGAARVGSKAAKSQAPMHQHFQSAASKKYGTLKSNIKVKASKRDRKKGQRGAYITTDDAFWGHFYELGTQRYQGKRKHGSSQIGSRYQPARPWFLPAITRAYKEMVAELAARLGSGIVREATKQTASGKATRDVIDGF